MSDSSDSVDEDLRRQRRRREVLKLRASNILLSLGLMLLVFVFEIFAPGVLIIVMEVLEAAPIPVPTISFMGASYPVTKLAEGVAVADIIFKIRNLDNYMETVRPTQLDPSDGD